MFLYRVHGLNISSELECPSLEKATGKEDLFIRFGKVQHTSSVGKDFHGAFTALGKNTLCANIKGIAHYLVKEGREIIIERYPDADDDHVRLFLLGTMLGIILHMRGFLPLHACGIVHKGKAILFMGDSGVGKSTLTEAFRRKGYQLLSDDVCCVRIGDDNRASIFPSIPGISLSLDSMDYFQLPKSEFKRGLHFKSKYVYPRNDSFSDKEVPLKQAYILKIHESDKIILKNPNKLEKAALLREETYRKLAIKKLGRFNYHLNQCVRLSKMMEMKVLHRPDEILRLPEIVTALEKDFQ